MPGQQNNQRDPGARRFAAAYRGRAVRLGAPGHYLGGTA